MSKPPVTTAKPPAAPVAPRNRGAAQVLAQSEREKSAAQPVVPSAAAPAKASERQAQDFAAAPMPNAGMITGVTAGVATREVAAPLDVIVAADEARQEEKTNATTAARSKAVATGPTALERRAGAGSSVVLQSAPSMAAAGASMARLMPGADATQRLAGCYTLELRATASQSERDESIARQLPRRVELLVERAALPAGVGDMLLTPAAGEPALAAGTQGTWQATARDAVRIRIGEGTRSVSATLTLAGASVSGIATAGDRKSIVKGAKIVCVKR